MNKSSEYTMLQGVKEKLCAIKSLYSRLDNPRYLYHALNKVGKCLIGTKLDFSLRWDGVSKYYYLSAYVAYWRIDPKAKVLTQFPKFDLVQFFNYEDSRRDLRTKMKNFIEDICEAIDMYLDGATYKDILKYRRYKYGIDE